MSRPRPYCIIRRQIKRSQSATQNQSVLIDVDDRQCRRSRQVRRNARRRRQCRRRCQSRRWLRFGLDKLDFRLDHFGLGCPIAIDGRLNLRRRRRVCRRWRGRLCFGYLHRVDAGLHRVGSTLHAEINRIVRRPQRLAFQENIGIHRRFLPVFTAWAQARLWIDGLPAIPAESEFAADAFGADGKAPKLPGRRPANDRLARYPAAPDQRRQGREIHARRRGIMCLVNVPSAHFCLCGLPRDRRIFHRAAWTSPGAFFLEQAAEGTNGFRRQAGNITIGGALWSGGVAAGRRRRRGRRRTPILRRPRRNTTEDRLVQGQSARMRCALTTIDWQTTIFSTTRFFPNGGAKSQTGDPRPPRTAILHQTMQPE